MCNRRVVLAIVTAYIVALSSAGPTEARAPIANVNHVTFNAAVALPGVVLLPGRYAFEAGPVGTHPDIVRVTSADYRTLYYVGFTLRTPRPATMAPHAVLSLGEASPGSPVPITAWYPIGSMMGHAFRYR